MGSYYKNISDHLPEIAGWTLAGAVVGGVTGGSLYRFVNWSKIRCAVVATAFPVGAAVGSVLYHLASKKNNDCGQTAEQIIRGTIKDSKNPRFILAEAVHELSRDFDRLKIKVEMGSGIVPGDDLGQLPKGGDELVVTFGIPKKQKRIPQQDSQSELAEDEEVQSQRPQERGKVEYRKFSWTMKDMAGDIPTLIRRLRFDIMKFELGGTEDINFAEALVKSDLRRDLVCKQVNEDLDIQYKADGDSSDTVRLTVNMQSSKTQALTDDDAEDPIVMSIVATAFDEEGNLKQVGTKKNPIDVTQSFTFEDLRGDRGPFMEFIHEQLPKKAEKPSGDQQGGQK